MSKLGHVVLNHVDTPLKYLFWSKGELFLFLGPILMGVVVNQFFAGVILALFNAWVVSRYKKKFGKGKCQAVMYWYLPKKKSLQTTPPSFIREYLG